jgi:kinesin family protein 12
MDFNNSNNAAAVNNANANNNMAGFRMLQEFEFEIQRLRDENSQIRYQKEITERDFEGVMFENNTLYGKLENLENVFIGSSIQRDFGGGSSSVSSKMSQDYTTSTLMLENTELKKKVARIEEEKLEMKQTMINMSTTMGGTGGAA